MEDCFTEVVLWFGGGVAGTVEIQLHHKIKSAATAVRWDAGGYCELCRIRIYFSLSFQVKNYPILEQYQWEAKRGTIVVIH